MSMADYISHAPRNFFECVNTLAALLISSKTHELIGFVTRHDVDTIPQGKAVKVTVELVEYYHEVP